MSELTFPVAILGSTGYVAGELLRLVAGHPSLRLGAAVSRSRAAQEIGDTFPHLRGPFAGERFAAPEALLELLEAEPTVAVFAALPHGESAARVARLFEEAEERGCALALVDLSADFRHPSAELYAVVYGQPHAAPEVLERFTCRLPDLERETPPGPVAHPGCFTTAVTLACRPLHALDLCEPRYMVSAVTGATGSGRTPRETTHYPERGANLFAYKPLAHRHRPEMERLIGGDAAGAPEVLFVPHSGPFSRGIHATVHARLREPSTTEELVGRLDAFYAATPFVRVGAEPPALKEVVGTNRCALGVAVDGRDVVVLSVIDNLTKGAAGGAVQWMNRLLGLPEDAGLNLCGVGWNG